MDLIIEIERGLVPEFAVTAIFPSLLRASPKGCGATVSCLPAGVIRRPFGITVAPSLFIKVYFSPAGAEML